MLVLSRKPGETIVIGKTITVEVRGIKGNRVILAIDAPKSVPIHRNEIYEKPQRTKAQEGDNQISND
ncbi:MAG: carbon storage regulator CsrA [Candidatus Staskawiczbacteria bacterium]|nr:carbon storage regulator CsrA [Candidatus Staskawiczbacteria bacterium]